MFFLEQLQKQFLSTLKADFQGGEPRGDDYLPDTPTNLKNSDGERVKDGLGQNINPQELSEEQQKVLEEIQGLQNELEGLEATKKFNATAGEYLSKKLTPEDYKDPEAQETIRQLELYKTRFLDAQKAIGETKQNLAELKESVSKLSDSFEYKTGFDINKNGEKKENTLTSEELKTITNSEFLGLPKEERLQYVTENNRDHDSLSLGSQVTFFFDHDGNGKDDTDLYRLTTAGQVFGDEVGALVVGGNTYTRSGIGGEFFSGNSRLTIHTGTQVEVVMRTEGEINAMRDMNDTKFKNYTESIENFDQKNTDIVRESFKRGIEPDMVLDLFSQMLSNMTDEKRTTKIEELFTQVERIRSSLGLDENSPELKKALKDENNDSVIDNFVNLEIYGKGYEKYKEIVDKVAQDHNIPVDKLVTLINHENAKWDPGIKAPGSSAFGLGQMINGTWEVYGKGLNRYNPEDQLIATARYLNAIMNRQGCSIDMALAYYNTGEGILKVSDSKAQEYARLNPAIERKIPNGIDIDAQSYFIGAVAYYNDISYNEAKDRV